ncbi:MAG: binding-protein-dependent transport system inner rane component [Thermomicrobiales bacterium]|jgi:peptide/nickel transport system permease protein|nr:binding-protein-dependent transport system inner rane component [Thermomicrobiales bacterium]MDF3042046.1 binding-protein-dependent transport system inner rane component [Thermomicrobiales bacterium]
MANAVADASLPRQPTLGAPEAPRLISQRERAFRAFTSNRTAVLGVVMILAIVLIAVFAPVIAPHDPLSQSVRDRLAPPSAEHLLGTDDKGRDILSRVIYGARIALLVGIFSVALGGALGTAIGVVAGYFGGKIESALMRLTDVMLAFPDLITGLLVLAVLGPGLEKMILAIGLTIAPRFARIAYGPTLSVKGKEYVEAARSIGVKDGRLLRVHILPNVGGDLLVYASLWTASAIRLEASLSFIGLGVAPPTPTWGQMIREGTVHLAQVPWYSLAPGLALLATVFAFNLVGDGLRDVLDPKARA